MGGLEGRLDRREFVRGAFAVASAGALAQVGPASELATAAGKRRALPLRGARFRQGVAAGEPAPRAITLWTKLGGVERRGTVELEVARDPGFDRVVERRTVLARTRHDHAVKARVGNLKPNERYWYRFDSGQRSSPVGTFRTLPPFDSRLPVRVAIFSCQDYEPGFYTAHAGLAEERDIDLVVCLGDYIYERSFYEEKVRRDRTGANRDGEVQTLKEYRHKYGLYHADANLRRLRQSHAMLGIWDDHEAEDNYTAMLPGDATLDRRIAFARRRRNGYRAYFEHMPFRSPRKRERELDRFRVHRSLRLGRNAELILLDERKFKDDQPCGDEAPPGPDCSDAELNDPSRTMLGAKQKRWLKRRLRSSDATWKLVANQVMMMSLDVPPGEPFIVDQWDGYAAERREIVSMIRDRGIENVSFLTGDIHTFFAGDVTPSGRQNAAKMPAAVATEFVGGSMTSLGVPETLAGATGAPLPPEIIAVLADSAGIRANNPHITYSETEHRGYAVVEAHRDRLEVDYRAPATTKEPRSPMLTLKRFQVDAGTPRVEPL